MKFLLIPENNSLSHINKCLAIMTAMKRKGHEVQVAVSKKHADFLNSLGVAHHLLSDIQETDSGGFPTFKWFSNVDIISNCIREEVALINKVQPDRVLGIFRFTLFASAHIANVPYDSFICGCMIPDSHEVLGFAKNEPGYALQKKLLDNFFRFAGYKTSLALKKFGLKPIEDIRWALKGERTFLWDFPEFLPLPPDPDIIHVGPISSEQWPYDEVNLDKIIDSKRPIAVVAFGTCVADNATVSRIAKLLLALDYKVVIAAGGQEKMLKFPFIEDQVNICKYAPLTKIFPYTSLLVTHGGQMTVFEALQNKIPIVVMPLQPEQAHNGVCLERIGCGIRLIPPTLFSGLPDDYIKAFNQLTDAEIKTKITNLVKNDVIKENLTKIQAIIERYQGATALARSLEENTRCH